jgi:hypothetical protein
MNQASSSTIDPATEKSAKAIVLPAPNVRLENMREISRLRTIVGRRRGAADEIEDGAFRLHFRRSGGRIRGRRG